MKCFVCWSCQKSDATVGIGGCIPFVLTKDEPTEMHVSFYANGTRYDYDVKFNGKHIFERSLVLLPQQIKISFYERSFVGENVQADIKFGASLKTASQDAGEHPRKHFE